MKNLILLAASIIFFTSCEYTEVKNHTPAAGETYCAYDAQGATDIKFRVCVLCPTGNAMCGTITKVKVLREHHWFMPNEYDRYDLTRATDVNGCQPCTGTFIWEKD